MIDERTGQHTVDSVDDEVVFSDDSEDFSLVSDVVDVVVWSEEEEEEVVTEVCERVSVTVTISFD